MSNLISREDAINALVNLTCYGIEEMRNLCESSVADSEGWLGGIRDAVDEIETLPSAEPERTAKVKRCSFGEYLTYDFDGQCDCGKWVDSLWNYCPSCGARLEWSE